MVAHVEVSLALLPNDRRARRVIPFVERHRPQRDLNEHGPRVAVPAAARTEGKSIVCTAISNNDLDFSSMCQSPVIRLILKVSLAGSPNVARPSSFEVVGNAAADDALPGVISRGLTESFPSVHAASEMASRSVECGGWKIDDMHASDSNE